VIKPVRSPSRLDVLAFWRAVELFAPQQIPKLSEDQVCDYVLSECETVQLPWSMDPVERGVRLRPRQTFQHDVFIGVYSLDEAYSRLRVALDYPDEGENGDPPQAGQSALAAFTVADDGRLLLGSQVLSSCAWGLARAFSGEPVSQTWLADFGRALGEFDESLETLAEVRDGADGDDLDELEEHVGTVVDGELLEQIHGCVMDVLCAHGAGAEVISKAATVRVRTRVVGVVNRYRVRERCFLNSFIAGDLDIVSQALAAGSCGSALGRYLAGAMRADARDAPARVDVEHAIDYVRAALAPQSIPAGRWPSSSCQPSDLGQQLAVNTVAGGEILGEMFGGLMAVNGPPGTGKTTMLRDILAALVVQRARRLAELESPQQGFRGAPIRLPVTGRSHSVYRLASQLTGFEMVLACTTNAAAENVSTEIPLLDAVASEWREQAGYFAATARSVLGARDGEVEDSAPQVWGMLAACLGSLSRCKAFATTFWFAPGADGSTDDDTEFSAGLRDVLGAHDPQPRDWEQAVAAFKQALARVSECGERSERCAALFTDLQSAHLELETQRERASEAQALAAEASCELDTHTQLLTRSAGEHEAALGEHNRQRGARPGLVEVVFSWGRAAREWRARDEQLAGRLGQAERAHAELEQTYTALADTLAEHRKRVDTHEQAHARAEQQIGLLEGEIAQAGESWREHSDGAVLPDDAWAALPRAQRELRAPWLDKAWDRARTELFIAALRLHEAFVLANASKMRSSLAVAMDMIQGSLRAQLRTRSGRSGARARPS
jgi:hypothetical protein